MKQDAESNHKVEGSVVAWAILVFALLFLGLMPLYVFHLNLANLKKSTQGAPAIALVGILFTAYTPTIAALLIAWLWPGGGGVRSLFRQVVRWRVHVGWYLIALLGPIPLLLLADVIYVVFGGPPPGRWLAMPSGASEGGITAIGFVIGAVIAGGLGEEFGWRGFGQARLQTRTGALRAAIVIGLLWSTWDLWPAVVPGGLSLFSWTDFPETYVRLVSIAILYAWLYNNTGGSLLLVLLAHGAYDVDNSIVQTPVSAVHTIPIIVAVLHGVAALAVVAVTNPLTLTRIKGSLASRVLSRFPRPH